MKVGIIGGGIAGCAAAHLISQSRSNKVTIFEASASLGAGNRTEWWAGHPYTFGPRHFLTQFTDVFEYFNKLVPLRLHSSHQFKTFVERDDAFYNYPINLQDIAKMPDADLINEELEEASTNKEQAVNSARNLKEYWLASVGDTLFSKFIDTYNKKMWLVDDCSEIDTFSWSPKGAAIKDGNRAAWSEAISAYPYAADGYNAYFDLATVDAEVRCSTPVLHIDFEKKSIVTESGPNYFDIVINTLSPDIIFQNCHGQLRYLGRDLLKIVLPISQCLPDDIYFLYYANAEPFTRIVEYKKFTHHNSPNTLIGLEIPSENGRFYPMPFKADIALSDQYFSEMPDWMYSIGRMGSYRYDVDIDDSIKQAMLIAHDISNKTYSGPVPALELPRL